MTIAIFASPADSGALAAGRTLGEAWPAQIQAAVAAYGRYFAAHDLDQGLARRVALATLDQVTAWAPWLADEIAGIAEGAAIELWQAAVLNARSEVLAHFRPATPGECSTAVYLPDGEQPKTIQTWDWNPRMNDAKLIWQYEPSPGWCSTRRTAPGCAATRPATRRSAPSGRPCSSSALSLAAAGWSSVTAIPARAMAAG
jgi:isopenicillin-N N-acyltransferase-like protein